MNDLKPCPSCDDGGKPMESRINTTVACMECGFSAHSKESWNARAVGWISVDDTPINGSYNWEVGDKAIAWGGYAFEIEWDGDYWCSIGGDDFTHWMPLPEPPKD